MTSLLINFAPLIAKPTIKLKIDTSTKKKCDRSTKAHSFKKCVKKS